MTVRTRLCRIAFSVLVLLALSGSPLAAQPIATVNWSAERLSVQAREAPLASVLFEVAHQADVRVHGLKNVDGTCSVWFTDRSLREGLRLLLLDFNYAMVMHEERSTSPIATIWIHSRAAPSGSVEASSVPPVVTTAADEWLMDELGVQDGMVEISESAVQEPTQEGDLDLTPDEQELRRLEATGFFANATVGALLQEAQMGSTPVRVRALSALRERDPSLAAEAAGPAIGDPDPAVSGAAAEVLAQLDDRLALESLGATLRNPDPAIRSVALEFLILRGDPASLPYVWQVLDDENPAIRARAEELVKLLEQSQGLVIARPVVEPELKRHAAPLPRR